MLNDSVFHLVQTKMVGIEDTLGVFQVEIVFRELLPRQVNQILQIVQLYAIFA